MAAANTRETAEQELALIAGELYLLLDETAGYHCDDRLRSWLRETQSALLVCIRRLQRMQQRFVVALAGMSNVGKSTLINALLGADVAPNANRPCTAAPIEFEYALDLGVTISSNHSISRRKWDCASLEAIRACLDRIAQRPQLRVNLRIVPIRLRHRRLEIVDHQPPGRAAEVMKGMLQAGDEVVDRLPPHRFAVRHATVGKHDSKDLRPAAFAGRIHDGCARAEVDLRFFVRRRFDPAKRQWRVASEPRHIAADAPVACRVTSLIKSW